jgi:hypothetical protein
MVTDCMFKQYQINYQTRRRQIIFGYSYRTSRKNDIKEDVSFDTWYVKYVSRKCNNADYQPRMARSGKKV